MLGEGGRGEKVEVGRERERDDVVQRGRPQGCNSSSSHQETGCVMEQ